MGEGFDDLSAVPIALTALRESERLAAAGLTPAHVSGEREAPWPHVQVEPATTSFGDPALTVMTDDVQVTVWGAPDGSTGLSALARLGRIVAGELVEVARSEAPHVPGTPVTSRVEIPSGPTIQKLTSGQRRAVLTASFTLRPSRP